MPIYFLVTFIYSIGRDIGFPLMKNRPGKRIVPHHRKAYNITCMPNFLKSTFFFSFVTIQLWLTASHAATPSRPPGENSSTAMKTQAWQALEKNDYTRTLTITEQCLTLYKEEARRLQESLNEYPRDSQASKYTALNDVGQCLLARGMALKAFGRPKEAEAAYRDLVENFFFSQVTDDPQCSWGWKPAEAALQKLAEMGVDPEIWELQKELARLWPDGDADAHLIAPWSFPDAFKGYFFWPDTPRQGNLLMFVIQDVRLKEGDLLDIQGILSYDNGEYFSKVIGRIDLSAGRFTFRETGPEQEGFTTAGRFEGTINSTLNFMEGSWAPDQQPNYLMGTLRLFALTPQGRALQDSMKAQEPSFFRSQAKETEEIIR